jgi:hypothetical protein
MDKKMSELQKEIRTDLIFEDEIVRPFNPTERIRAKNFMYDTAICAVIGLGAGGMHAAWDAAFLYFGVRVGHLALRAKSPENKQLGMRILCGGVSLLLITPTAQNLLADVTATNLQNAAIEGDATVVAVNAVAHGQRFDREYIWIGKFQPMGFKPLPMMTSILANRTDSDGTCDNVDVFLGDQFIQRVSVRPTAQNGRPSFALCPLKQARP